MCNKISFSINTLFKQEMTSEHHYETTIVWTGNKGNGTSAYDAYERAHSLFIEHKPDLLCSSDTPFRGEKHKHNPEDFLLSALSSCHMLWYLHLCADAGIVVTAYTDTANGTLDVKAGKFTSAILHPMVTVKESWMIDKANALHHAAHKKCFIANSCNFEVKHSPSCVAENNAF